MKSTKQILKKKLMLLEQKRDDIEDVYPSNNQISLLLSEIDYHKAELLKIELQEKYSIIENEDD